MTFRTLCYSLTLLSPLALPAAAQTTINTGPQAPVATIVQSSIAGGGSAPITLSLNTTPTVGNLLFAIVGYGIYGDRSIIPPDSSWTCNVGAGGSVKISTCSHVVIAGDGASYTFVPSSTDGPGIDGIILEASGVVSSQIAYSYAGSSLGLLQTTTSPSLTPSTLGTLPIGVTFGGGVPSAGTDGWGTLQATGGMGAFGASSLTTDTTAPISMNFNYVWNNAANSLQEMMLLVPGVFAMAPAATPAPGSYATTQNVVLSDPLAGSVIYYTLDGSAATCSSTVYSSPITITTTTTLSSIACASGYANSAVQTGTYVVAGGTLQGVSLGAMADLHGYIPFAGDAFHQDISASPVDSNSTNIIAGIGADHLHHDWSSINGGNYGIPYTVVDSTQTPLVPFVNQMYSDESDVTLYPIPNNLPIESTPPTCTVTGDNHAIILDKATGVDYEFYRAQYCPGSTPVWQAVNGVLWDMTINEKRPYTYTSVDAAGLSVFEGLVRYDEIVAGAINHALRFTTSMTRCDHYDYGDGQGAFVLPATHAACNNSGTLNITGMRIRLKASFDISSYSPVNQIILTAMKKYGMILADNGSSLFFQGTPDARWNDDDLQLLDAVSSSNFEVVQMPPIYTNDNYPSGAAPTITGFAPASATITQGQSVILNAATTGASYDYVDAAGFMRNSSMTVSPTQTTTYTLTSRNAFGSTTASTTVTVLPPAYKDPALAFTPIASQTLGTTPFTASTSSLSSGEITYSVMSGPATISGNTVTLTGIGTVVLQASQIASGLYTAATATTTFQVNGITPDLVFSPIADVVYGEFPFLISAHSSSPATIAYSVVSGNASINGRIVTVNGIGVVTLAATQQATGNYAAVTVQTSFTVKPAIPFLAFAPIPVQTYGTAPFQVFSVSNSSGGDTYSVISGPATISGNVVTLTGVGRVMLMVSQAAAGNYTAATAYTSFKILPGEPQLSFAPISSKTYGTAPFATTASSVSKGYVSYRVVSGPASVYGNVVTLNGAGTITLLADQAPTQDYLGATALISFTVSAGHPTLSLLVSSTDLPFLLPLNVEATIAGTGNRYPTGTIQIFDGSSLVGSYALGANAGGLLSPLSVTGLVSGLHTMTAVYSGDANYQGVNSSAVMVTVEPKLARISR